MSIDRADIFINSLGVEAYRVGGSVRDELLGRPAKDADYMIRGVAMKDLGELLRIAVKAWPKPSVRPLVLRDGRQAGWRVSAKGLGCIEIVLPRTEKPRAMTPEEVFQGGGIRRAFDIIVDPKISLREDAKRRDFTFNALYFPVGTPADDFFYSTIGEFINGRAILDPTHRGLYDLEHKLVSTTHEDSFRDDPLRTLRALRFVSTLGYDLSSETERQMTEHAQAVTGLSAKGYASGTVLDELSKLLMGDDAVKALRLARDTGVLAVVLPELAPMIGFDQRSRWHDLTTDEHTFKALETAVKVGAPLRVRWALLFHYEPSDKVWGALIEDGDKPQDHEIVGERIWRAAATRLGATKELRNEVGLLIRNHMVYGGGKNPATRVRRMRVQLGDDMLRDLFMHRMCDITGKARVGASGLADIAEMESLRREAAEAGVPCSVRDLAISGADLLALGEQGPEIGRKLAAVLDEIVCQPDELRLSRDWQLERAAKV